jgi:hypothetical protein
MIEIKSIMLSHPSHNYPQDLTSFSQADEVLQKYAAGVKPRAERSQVRVVTVFADLFIWASYLALGPEDATAKDFVQRAIKSDWEFNAGVRPTWWPDNAEADRMWGVHYREDRDNGRAELARLRLQTYDLRPVVLSKLPQRGSSALERLRVSGDDSGERIGKREEDQ